MTVPTDPAQQLARVRALTWFFIFGLVVSGLTALPLETELDWLARLLGVTGQTPDQVAPGFANWILRVRDALRETSARFPFLAYGTDWLAFGHLVIAVAFIGALRDPVRNRWLFDFGLIACALVVPTVDEGIGGTNTMNASAITQPDRPRERHLAALRHWSFHVTISAAPSFFFAFGHRWGSTQAICGMLLGVVFFIALYTALARWTFPREAGGSLWRRALRVGTWIRTVWAGLAFLGLLASLRGGKWFTLPFTPDIWAGMLACGIVQWLGTLPPVRWLRILLTGPDPAVRQANPWLGDMNSLVPTFLITVVEGFILSAVLFFIAFACLGVLRLASRRRREGTP